MFTCRIELQSYAQSKFFYFSQWIYDSMTNCFKKLCLFCWPFCLVRRLFQHPCCTPACSVCSQQEHLMFFFLFCSLNAATKDICCSCQLWGLQKVVVRKHCCRTIITQLTDLLVLHCQSVLLNPEFDMQPDSYNLTFAQIRQKLRDEKENVASSSTDNATMQK